MSERNGRGARGKPSESVQRFNDGIRQARSYLARGVYLVAVLAALILVVAAILTALKANPDNDIVKIVVDWSEWLVGPFRDLWEFESRIRTVVVNWLIAAVVYLFAGSLLRRLIGA